MTRHRTIKSWLVAKPRRKYGNTPTEYNGVRYHSAREAAYAAELNLLARAGKIEDWERQISFPLEVNDKMICRYVVDFRILHTDGSYEVVEIKGHETPEFKLKWALFDALYPDIKKRIVK